MANANGSVIVSATVYEDNFAAYMARVEGAAGAAITQATIDAIDYQIWDTTDPDNETAIEEAGTLTVADVVFDDLQTPSDDPRWRVDQVGYNFLFEVLADMLPTGGRTYTIECKFTPVVGGSPNANYAFHATFEIVTRPLRGS